MHLAQGSWSSFKDAEAAGFFVLRTPLLPFDEFLRWGELQGDASATSDARPLRVPSEELWRNEVEVLRDRLRRIIGRPLIRNALLLASTSLDSAIRYWERDPDSKKGLQVERALVRYFSRMCGRPTPFGLFSGCSVSRATGAENEWCDLRLDAVESYRATIDLDLDFLLCYVAAWNRDSSIRGEARYEPNPTLCDAGQGLHYLETRTSGGKRTLHFVQVPQDDYIKTVIARAEHGATANELVEALCDSRVGSANDRASAQSYVDQLIDNDVLVSNIYPNVTGETPLRNLIAQLDTLPSAGHKVAALRSIDGMLKALGEKATSASAEEYCMFATQLQGILGVEMHISGMLRVDLNKPLVSGQLPPVVINELLAGADVLLRFGRQTLPYARELQAFRDAFSDRFGSAWVPLLNALDEEVGVRFGSSDEAILRLRENGLERALRNQATPESQLSEVDPFLLKKIIEWAGTESRELVIDPAEVPPMGENPRNVPDAFSLTATLIAESISAVREGRFKIYMQYGDGPSGAALLGRFCHSDPKLGNFVRSFLREEECQNADSVYAEIVFAPPGRAVNVLCRPALRQYEIVYYGRSGVSREFQLPVSDLLVTVTKTGQILLKSQRLEKHVIPRLASAHAFRKPDYPAVYRFLCSLQFEKAAGVPSFKWGALNVLDFLPQVRVGRAVLSCARWRLTADEISSLDKKRRYDSFAAAQRIRERRCLPRWIVLAHRDWKLTVDLDNPLSVDSFAHVIRRQSEVFLNEMYPPAEELCCIGPEGHFCHELIVPFIRRKPVPNGASGTKPTPTGEACVARTLPPGSRWNYVKVYGGPVGLDEVLMKLPAILQPAIRDRFVSRWFFVRYSDPHEHLRIRVESPSAELCANVFRLLTSWLSSLVASRRAWKIQFDTYEREIERYGGPECILASEDLFCVDSAAVVKVLHALQNESTDMRWHAALLGVDCLFSDFVPDVAERYTIAEQLREGFRSKLTPDFNSRKHFSEKFRAERKTITGIIDPNANGLDALIPIREIFRERSLDIRPVVETINSLSRRGRQVNVPALLMSYVHMHINRIMIRPRDMHEMMIYDFLCRLYGERVARRVQGCERTPMNGQLPFFD